MENKHSNILIVLAFLVFFIFASISIYNIKNFKHDEKYISSVHNDTSYVENKEGSKTHDKLDIILPPVDMSENDVSRIKLQKNFLDFINMIYKGNLNDVYNLINKEYIESYNVYAEEFETTFNQIKQYKHFIIVKDYLMEDRYIIRVRFYEDSSNESRYTDKTFTVFIEDSNVSYADRGIFFEKEIDVVSEAAEVKATVSKVFSDYEGMFYEVELLNVTEQPLEIESIYGIKGDYKIKHEILNSTFINYELRSNFPRKNLIFFNVVEELDSIEIKLNNEVVLNIEL